MGWLEFGTERMDPGFSWRRRLAILAGALAAMLQIAGVRASDAPFGLDARVPWVGSRLVGSPEPPLAYTVEKVFTNIVWRSPIYIADEPGTNQLLVVQAGGEPERPSRI